MNETVQSIKILEPFPEEKKKDIDRLLASETDNSRIKIVVLDDDPTGVQTVHDVSVYTDWSKESIKQGFEEKNRLFFILTNSRGFTSEKTASVHKEIAENIDAVSRSTGIDYLVISRSDSTLRGHYPLETEILREVYENKTGKKVDGEILCPYFHEGGRFTIGDVHYVKYGSTLVPAGQTEFAKDESFGYTSSNLKEYIEEKIGGTCRKKDVISVSLDELRAVDLEGIVKKLCQVRDFGKIIVNAEEDYDVEVFAVALYRTLSLGKHFIIRGAAAIVRAMGNISQIPLLKRKDMIRKDSLNGGIIVIGSHTKKTTDQLEELKELEGIRFIEMNSDLVLEPGALEGEVSRIVKLENELIPKGITVCVSTKRKVLTVEGDTPDRALLRSVDISEALQKCVGLLGETPAFVIAKGGITSSDVGTKALKVKRARVLGQIQPGVPVWQTGEESTFPGIPYVIFPGNVGEVDTLKKAAAILLEQENN